MSHLIYVSPAQVGAIAPYVLGKSATVRVSAGALRSNKLRFEVAGSAPALFTADSSGAGQAAALNEDNRANSETNPTRAGSIVQFFATGEGLTDPAVADGRIADTILPKPLLPVEMKIGGLDAEIVYFGAAPGATAGLMQVNARIPPGVSGPKMPVVLTVGGRSSPEGVTIAVAAP